MLAKQRGAVTTSGCAEKIPCSWVRQDRKNIHIVAIVLYYNYGCHKRRSESGVSGTSAASMAPVHSARLEDLGRLGDHMYILEPFSQLVEYTGQLEEIG